MPAERVLENISTRVVKFMVGTDHAFKVIALPETRLERCPGEGFDAVNVRIGGQGLEGTDHIAQWVPFPRDPVSQVRALLLQRLPQLSPINLSSPHVPARAPGRRESRRLAHAVTVLLNANGRLRLERR